MNRNTTGNESEAQLYNVTEVTSSCDHVGGDAAVRLMVVVLFPAVAVLGLLGNAASVTHFLLTILVLDLFYSKFYYCIRQQHQITCITSTLIKVNIYSQVKKT